MLYLSYIMCSCKPIKKLKTSLLKLSESLELIELHELYLNFNEIRVLICIHTHVDMKEWYGFAEHMLFMGSSEFPDENEVCTMYMFRPFLSFT